MLTLEHDHGDLDVFPEITHLDFRPLVIKVI